jgi:hypothetical protein
VVLHGLGLQVVKGSQTKQVNQRAPILMIFDLPRVSATPVRIV